MQHRTVEFMQFWVDDSLARLNVKHDIKVKICVPPVPCRAYLTDGRPLLLRFHPETIKSSSSNLLRCTVAHEVLHAAYWDVTMCAIKGMSKSAYKIIDHFEESIVESLEQPISKLILSEKAALRQFSGP